MQTLTRMKKSIACTLLFAFTCLAVSCTATRQMNMADYIVNSGMPYELSLYRQRMLMQFEAWSQQYQGDPLREDACTRSGRIAALLRSVAPLEDESIIPAGSVLREFIGGSSYE